jgi:hypothetical protein
MKHHSPNSPASELPLDPLAATSSHKKADVKRAVGTVLSCPWFDTGEILKEIAEAPHRKRICLFRHLPVDEAFVVEHLGRKMDFAEYEKIRKNPGAEIGETELELINAFDREIPIRKLTEQENAAYRKRVGPFFNDGTTVYVDRPETRLKRIRESMDWIRSQFGERIAFRDADLLADKHLPLGNRLNKTAVQLREIVSGSRDQIGKSVV